MSGGQVKQRLWVRFPRSALKYIIMATYKRRLRIERLAKREESQTVKRVVWLSIVSVILAILIFTLGIPLLGKFADFLDVIFGDRNGSSQESKALQAPRLDDLPEATNSAIITVSGFASEGNFAQIYLAAHKIKEVEIEGNSFKYENLKLNDGENSISAKVKNEEGLTSDFSQTMQIVYDNQPPKLEIEVPSEGQMLYGNNRAKVSGTTDRDAQVFANGFLASLDFNGKFEVFVPLTEGENTIDIKAVDPAGNSKVESRKVNFRK